MVASGEFYLQRLAQFQAGANQLEKEIRRLGVARLGLALLIIAFAYFGFVDEWFFYPIAPLTVLFFYLVKKQSGKEEERRMNLHLVTLNHWESEACSYKFDNFPNGSRFIDPHHPFSYDLDVFGSGSLLQFLNRCSTHVGEQRLAKDLTDFEFDKESVQQRQEAIRELGSLIEFRQQCWATGKEIHDADFNLESFWSWLREPALFKGKKSLQLLRWLLPSITLLSLLGILFSPAFKPIFFTLFFLQLSLTSYYNKQITRLQNQLSAYRRILESYAKIFDGMKIQSFTSSLMIGHHRLAKEATHNVKEISSLINAIESRQNVFARLLGNGLFLYDFHCVINLEKWREQHKSSMPGWIDSLAEWDALLSFATFHYNNPDYAFAQISRDLTINGKQVGHPLISTPGRVKNDFELGMHAGVMLITGANMAGKSTFLRTVGINYLLASNGAPACAAQWTSPLAELRTGMRTSDSLQDHQSYFYAELNRLQSIIKDLKDGKSMVILLDEILKGTNSTDKQMGSRELIKQLIQHKALALIATHDIALADMEQQYPQHVVNTCFEGNIEAEQLTFDYKLKLGFAQKANATFLMKKMGIIP